MIAVEQRAVSFSQGVTLFRKIDMLGTTNSLGLGDTPDLSTDWSVAAWFPQSRFAASISLVS
jgi:hypothetical protein